MDRSQFSYSLPEALIADYPVPQRSDSRLLVLDGGSGACRHQRFYQLPGLLRAGDLLVFNDTRVIPARLFAHKSSGGAVEILIERIVDEQRAIAQLRASKAPKPGAELRIEGGGQAHVRDRDGRFFELEFAPRTVMEVLEAVGHMPLPPYIQRADEGLDQQRYQTVYAKNPGAVAAPTAGLHFDERLLQTLREMGVDFAYTTLHVGAGTFQPVRAEDIREHHMHREWFQVSDTVVEQVTATRARGGRVIAVGTTSVRCLESAAVEGQLTATRGDTDIFIYPGYSFRVVDMLITNFHLPESTLLMLVSAFAGYRHTMAAYREAVERNYRFFSYGDAMLIARNPEPDMPPEGGGAS